MNNPINVIVNMYFDGIPLKQAIEEVSQEVSGDINKKIELHNILKKIRKVSIHE